jgi:hypothetical protein
LDLPQPLLSTNLLFISFQVVLKVGTSSLVRPEQQTLNLSNLARICETVKVLHNQGKLAGMMAQLGLWGPVFPTPCCNNQPCNFAGHHVIIVSSGAVGVGCQRMRLQTKPTEVAKKQALAAIGQVHLMRYYEDFFSALNMVCLEQQQEHGPCSSPFGTVTEAAAAHYHDRCCLVGAADMCTSAPNIRQPCQ